MVLAVLIAIFAVVIRDGFLLSHSLCEPYGLHGSTSYVYAIQ